MKIMIFNLEPKKCLVWGKFWGYKLRKKTNNCEETIQTGLGI